MEYFLDSLEMEAFRFLRIGEETDDIEASGDYRDNPFRLDVKRSLSFRKPRHHAGIASGAAIGIISWLILQRLPRG